MKSFTLSNGATYCTQADGSRVCTGSQMGRPDVLPEDRNTPCKLRLVRLPFVGGCYDRWGAYWGIPANIYCAWVYKPSCVSIMANYLACVFVRADSRDQAKAKVRSSLPNARFFN